MLHFFIYSTDIRTEYFKHAAYSTFIPLQNVVFFLVPVLFTFYKQGVLKFKINLQILFLTAQCNSDLPSMQLSKKSFVALVKIKFKKLNMSIEDII